MTFGSAGEGTDVAAGDAFDALVAATEHAVGRTLEAERSYWGMEGDHDICMLLAELTPGAARAFVAAVRARLQRYPLVVIAEDSACRPSR